MIEKELPIADKPWALKPVEGVVCPSSRCHDTRLEDKGRCMQNGCPYHLDGDDGFTDFC